MKQDYKIFKIEHKEFFTIHSDSEWEYINEQHIKNKDLQQK